MEEHIKYLETVCRLCGKNLARSKASVAKKETLKEELWKKFQINVDLDSREIHPPSICSGCKRLFYRVRGVSDPEKVATNQTAQGDIHIHVLYSKNLEINGEPTTTSRPSSTQKFSRNKQAGGGAYIPATLLVEGPREYEKCVLEKIRSTLPECENEDELYVKCLK